jgi:hypothetical protein
MEVAGGAFKLFQLGLFLLPIGRQMVVSGLADGPSMIRFGHVAPHTVRGSRAGGSLPVARGHQRGLAAVQQRPRRRQSKSPVQCFGGGAASIEAFVAFVEELLRIRPKHFRHGIGMFRIELGDRPICVLLFGGSGITAR